MGDCAEMVSRARVQQPTVDQTFDRPVPRVMEERISECIVEQIIDVPVIQILVEIVESEDNGSACERLQETESEGYVSA